MHSAHLHHVPGIAIGQQLLGGVDGLPAAKTASLQVAYNHFAIAFDTLNG